MGKITDTDMTVYQVTEILFHTPSDHTIIGKRYPLEV
jgi:carbonic anhydrase